jgi:mannose-6-phosphate isomerase-like protein (cupin superfamily)
MPGRWTLGRVDEQKTSRTLFELADVQNAQDTSGRRYLEFLRVPAMSAGLYALPPGGTDPQHPHREDELYVVLAGRAVLRVGTVDRPVGPGTVCHVPGGVAHRFHSISERLRVLVLFAPAESDWPAGAAGRGTGS